MFLAKHLGSRGQNCGRRMHIGIPKPNPGLAQRFGRFSGKKHASGVTSDA